MSGELVYVVAIVGVVAVVAIVFGRGLRVDVTPNRVRLDASPPGDAPGADENLPDSTPDVGPKTGTSGTQQGKGGRRKK